VVSKACTEIHVTLLKSAAAGTDIVAQHIPLIETHRAGRSCV
jgi:hypothetical protein